MTELRLVDHDPAWREEFRRVRDRIRGAGGEGLLGVFHIGSTAVEDLAAKPVVDVLAVFQEYGDARETADALVAEGYDCQRDDPDWIVLSRTEGQPVVVHLHPRSAETWREQLLFREYLRDRPAARTEYERAKRRAVAENPDDVAAYTEAKNETIRSLVARAREAGYEDRLPEFGE